MIALFINTYYRIEVDDARISFASITNRHNLTPRLSCLLEMI